MGRDPGRVCAVSASHAGTAETTDQRSRDEANYCGDEKALAFTEGGGSRKESRTRPAKGRCQKGGGKGTTSEGGEEEFAGQEGGGEEDGGCTDGDGRWRSVVRFTTENSSQSSLSLPPAFSSTTY